MTLLVVLCRASVRHSAFLSPSRWDCGTLSIVYQGESGDQWGLSRHLSPGAHSTSGAVFSVKHGPLLQGVPSNGGVDYKQVGESEQHSRGGGVRWRRDHTSSIHGKALVLDLEEVGCFPGLRVGLGLWVGKGKGCMFFYHLLCARCLKPTVSFHPPKNSAGSVSQMSQWTKCAQLVVAGVGIQNPSVSTTL